ncbi:MAG: amino acid permease [Candidatus Thermoplasmatota archaeon]|nr:amino acid permease [Candidatus Thermoplasmatota archaeon]MEC9136893.1 amino acid permease [Candidatus Thermoplasmatota archaeon]
MRHYGPEDLVGIVLTPRDTESDGLERKLGLFSVIVISLSAMIGSGLFVLPALAMLELGGGDSPLGGVWLAYLVAAFLVIPGAVSKSELSTAMPTSGGSYVYVQKTFGPLIGTVAGLGLWANFMLKSAFALIGFKAYLWVIEDLLGMDIDIEAAAIILLAIIVGINILGVKKIKKVQIPIVIFSASYLFALCVYAIAYHDLDWSAVASRDSFGSWDDVAATSAFVFVSYAGVTKIAAVAGEVKSPERNLPYGILLSLLFSCLLYVLVTMVMAAAVPPSEFMHGEHGASEDPIYIFAEAVGGETVGKIAAILAVVTMTSMALAGILASSRFPFAMSRDNLLPPFLESVHQRFGTPHWAIIGTGVAMGLAITFLPVHDVAELASGFKIMIFMLINGCVIVLRTSSDSHKWYDPKWKTPWPLYPAVQLFGIFGGGALLYLMGSKSLVGASAAIVLGLIIYNGYGRNRVDAQITPWETVRLMLTNADEAERRRLFAAFYDADEERDGQLNLDQFVSAFKALGYIEGGGPNIPDDAIVLSKTRNRRGDQLIGDVFGKGDTDKDGLISIEEFLEVAREIEPEG